MVLQNLPHKRSPGVEGKERTSQHKTGNEGAKRSNEGCVGSQLLPVLHDYYERADPSYDHMGGSCFPVYLRRQPASQLSDSQRLQQQRAAIFQLATTVI